MWEESRFFKDKYIVMGWTFKTAYNFPRVQYVAADTETKLYYENELLSEDKAYNIYREHGQKYFRENVVVKAYAFMLSDGKNFALFQNAEDFLTCLSMFHVERVFWYNAKFDFAIFDYFFLTNGWKDTTTTIEENKRYMRFPDKTFQSLNGEFGQRYAMRIWKSYINNRSQEKVHNFQMIDVCNIFGGGLRKNLEDWKIKDYDGNDVRKLEMDYVESDLNNAEDITYMINDTKGLYLLAEQIDKTLLETTGFSLFKGDFMTAGGLAKKTLLNFMFGKSVFDNVKTFKKCFPISAEEDEEFRNNRLYLGGKCFVNPAKVGVVQNTIYKYDVNSMYPTQMRDMLYPFGRPKKYKKLNRFEKDKCYIFCIKNLFGVMKRGRVPVWQDSLNGDYTEVIREPEKRYIWLEELDEIKFWYDIEYDVVFILEYDGKRPKGCKRYIDTFYDIKCTKKGAVKQGAKLLLNSAYGKLAQKIDRKICCYELGEDGVVHLVKEGEKTDEKSMLSVVVGSRITALARVMLMKYIRDMCGPDISEKFIYCDTDSVHALKAYDKCDDKKLGFMKCEGIYEKGLYLAPKTYLMYDGKEYEVHCKGVNTNVVLNEIKDKTFDDACDIFKPLKTFKCLSGLNVKGGKALVYVDKMILNDDNIKIVKDSYGELEEIDND